ncbi:MAG: hypothetical protein U1E56_00440 [Bauldia sp.]
MKGQSANERPAKGAVSRGTSQKRRGWLVVGADGKSRVVYVSSASSAAIDEAVRIYGRALKRLADR